MMIEIPLEQTSHSVASVLNATLQQHDNSATVQIAEDVIAMITVEEDLRFLPQTLHSVLSQRMIPRHIAIVDATGNADVPVVEQYAMPVSTGEHLSITQTFSGLVFNDEGQLQQQPTSLNNPQEHIDIVLIRLAKHPASFGTAINQAIALLPNRPTESSLLWLLHDDSRPVKNNCLDRLLTTAQNALGAGIVGAKQMDWKGESLYNVGYLLTRSSHRASLVVEGEPDQEQFDNRTEMYAVSLAGALVRYSTWHALQGTVSWFGTFGESFDFCRRVYYFGQRVIVAPTAIIAHARSRYDGYRTHAGKAVSAHRKHSAQRQVMQSRERFILTNTRALWWPLLFIWRIFTSFALSIACIARRNIRRAIVELFAPLTLLLSMPMALAQQHSCRSLGVMHKTSMNGLIATRAQMRQWHDRQQIFAHRKTQIVVTSLARLHLRSLAIRRSLWLGFVLLIVGAGSVAANISVLQDILVGKPIVSTMFPASTASWSQLWHSATSFWSYGGGFGYGVPPAPLLFILSLLSLPFFGNVTVLIGCIALLTPLLSAIGFWLCVGTITRSHSVRAMATLVWAAALFATGIISSLNIPMDIVVIGLPLALYMMLRSVGMYCTDAPKMSYPSVRAGAIASLLCMVIVCAEPQLFFMFIALWCAYLVMVRYHRSTLMLFPLPACVALLPTLVYAAQHITTGAWNILFTDMTVGHSTALDGALWQQFMQLAQDIFAIPSQGIAFWGLLLCMVGLLAIAILAMIALFIPNLLRISRMLWVAAALGLATVCVAMRTTISIENGNVVVGSVLPGLFVILLALLLCAVGVAGNGIATFGMGNTRFGQIHYSDTLRSSTNNYLENDDKIVESARTSSSENVNCTSSVQMRIIGKFGRVILTFIFAAVACAFAVPSAMHWRESYDITPVRHALPIAATDVLHQDEARRILAIQVQSYTHVQYSLLRTSVADAIDTNSVIRAVSTLPKVQDIINEKPAQVQSQRSNQELRDAVAHLLAGNDSRAITTLTKLGIGGIYIPDINNPLQRYIFSHVSASEGSQLVVNNANGAYLRLQSNTPQAPRINTAGAVAMNSSWYREIWVIALIAMLVIYGCIAIIPKHAMRKEW